MARTGPRDGLKIVRLTPSRMDDMGKVLSGSWGAACWCMFPRLTAKTRRKLPPAAPGESRSRTAMTALAAKRRAPGLLAYVGDDVAGWIAIAPRPELARTDSSKATPRVDDVAVWVIPCITVARRFRGRGVARALIGAAVEHAGRYGAPAVEGYPRASNERVNDDFAFIGTESLFRKAGFRKVRGPLEGVPRGWTPRVTMRIACTSKTSPPPRARSASG
jgi:GNAT superfamily N-acetyltransferase